MQDGNEEMGDQRWDGLNISFKVCLLVPCGARIRLVLERMCVCIGWLWGHLPFLLVGMGGFWYWVGVRLMVKKTLRECGLDHKIVVYLQAFICLFTNTLDQYCNML